MPAMTSEQLHQFLGGLLPVVALLACTYHVLKKDRWKLGKHYKWFVLGFGSFAAMMAVVIIMSVYYRVLIPHHQQKTLIVDKRLNAVCPGFGCTR
jgi:hypothetical protein